MSQDLTASVDRESRICVCVCVSVGASVCVCVCPGVCVSVCICRCVCEHGSSKMMAVGFFYFFVLREYAFWT